VGAAAIFTGETAMSLEQPEYTVVYKDGDVEYRQYEPYLVSETIIDSANDYQAAGTEGFRRLFRYITGANAGRQNIAMTAPVAQTRGEKIAMTVPVQQADSAAGWSVAFMLPSQYTLDDAPVPTDPRVRVRQVPGRLMAVIRYSGRWTEKNFAAKSEVLQKVMQEESVAPLGEVHSALYNAPYTPPFMRRNEVMVEANRLPAQAVKRLEEHQLASY
jgi:uncharacterized protein YacL (UPF0231 family)